MPATKPMKRSAVKFVNKKKAGRQTATFDALDAAFRFDVEAIYFLSDGSPTVGRIVDPNQILTTVTQGNRQRMITLYAFGVGPLPGGRFEKFLMRLAQKNFGIYRRVGRAH